MHLSQPLLSSLANHEGAKVYWGMRCCNTDMQGVRIFVMKDGPAAKAGLCDDDIILQVNNASSFTRKEFVGLVGNAQVGERFVLTVQRGAAVALLKKEIQVEVRWLQAPQRRPLHAYSPSPAEADIVDSNETEDESVSQFKENASAEHEYGRLSLQIGLNFLSGPLCFLYFSSCFVEQFV